MKKAIMDRWSKRVVPNGWDKMGAEGAKMYIDKYGKNISNDKLKDFAEYARSLGLNDFANGMEGKVNVWKVVTLEYAEANNFNDDMLDQYDSDDACIGKDHISLVETTIGELAKRKVATFCGDNRHDHNQPFVSIATKYPNHKVRCCVEDNKGKLSVGCVDIFIGSEAEGEDISELASMGGGTLRCDYGGKGACWTYFENE